MSFNFRPANTFTDRHGLFVAVAGGTNSGKSFSALRLARGIAGPSGKIAAVDTEGGRLLHLKQHFDFDLDFIEPPHRPERYADAAKDAEAAGYACLVIDSYSMAWVGMGGVLDWQAQEYERMGAREAVKLASWIKPKMAHKASVYSFLQRRMPIVFALRAEEKAKKVGSEVKSEWAPICNKAFPFEVTVSFMLMQARQGVIDLSLPHKMEGPHRDIFKDGEQLSERHGEMLAAWAAGGSAPTVPIALADAGRDAADHGTAALKEWFERLSREEKLAIRIRMESLKRIAADADADQAPATPTAQPTGLWLDPTILAKTKTIDGADYQTRLAALLAANPSAAADIQLANKATLDRIAKEDPVRADTLRGLFLDAMGAGEEDGAADGKEAA